MALAVIAEGPTLPKLQRACGEGRIVARRRGDITEIAELYQDGCAKIRLPHTHSQALQAVLMNTAGGLTGGDRLRWSATAEEGTSLTLTTPACERVYRSIGDTARVDNRLVAAPGAHIDWLPQETILFEHSRLDRRLEVDLAEGASLTAVEAILLGREAMGEGAWDAHLRDNWRIRRNGRLLHAEATALTGDRCERSGLSLLQDALAFATVLHISDHAERHLDTVRAILPESGGASLIGDRLTVRLLAPSGLALRRVLAPIIALLSDAGSIPRLWTL